MSVEVIPDAKIHKLEENFGNNENSKSSKNNETAKNNSP